MFDSSLSGISDPCCRRNPPIRRNKARRGCGGVVLVSGYVLEVDGYHGPLSTSGVGVFALLVGLFIGLFAVFVLFVLPGLLLGLVPNREGAGPPLAVPDARCLQL